MEGNLWWGYKHVSGTYQAKRYFDRRDTQEAHESPMCDQVVGPFTVPADAENQREWAINYVKSQTS